MVIEGPVKARKMIKLNRIDFDDGEALASATFEVALATHVRIADVLSESVPAVSENGRVLITLDVPQIRRLVTYFGYPRTPKTEEADAIFNRLIVILGTFREDLL